MTFRNPSPQKTLYPPEFIACDPKGVSIYDNWREPEAPSLDIRLALEKAKSQASISRVSPPPSVRSLTHPRFKLFSPSSFRRHLKHQAKQHNNVLSVCRLPKDVLWKIFLECARFPPMDLANWSWMNVSYVCSTWRSAALQCRKLWTYIDFTHPSKTLVSLERAKGQPLSIRTVVNSHNGRRLRNVLNTAHQVYAIRLDSSFDDIQPLLETLAHPNPSLTSLFVNVTSQGSSAVAYPRHDFPLFGQQLKLKTAELHGAPLYLLAYHCPSLTHLTLRNLPQSESQSDLLTLLANLPQLQFFTVAQCTIHGGPPNHQIHLPELKHFKIGGSIQQIADILELVTFPTSCRLSCSLDRLDNLSSSLRRLCTLIGAQSYRASQDVPLETLILTGNEISTRFTNDYDLNPDFRQSIRIRAFGPIAIPGSAAFDISIGPTTQVIPDDAMSVTLSSIWRALSLASVQTLSLQNVDIATQKIWTQFLRTLPELRVLDIRGHVPSGLAWALLSDALSADGDSPRCLAPRLDDIYLHGVDCSSGGLMLAPNGQMNSHSDLDDSRFLDVLTTCLKHRRRHRMKLRSLTMTRCEYVVQKTMDEMMRTVPNVLWDGRGRTVEDVGARYRNMPQNVPRGDLHHYHRLKALLS